MGTHYFTCYLIAQRLDLPDRTSFEVEFEDTRYKEVTIRHPLGNLEQWVGEVEPTGLWVDGENRYEDISHLLEDKEIYQEVVKEIEGA